MTTTWILEDNIFDKSYFGEMKECFYKYDIPYHIVEISNTEIIGKVPKVSGQVVFYGSINGQRVVTEYGWSPGVWNNPTLFSEQNLINVIGDRALNSDNQIMLFRDVLKNVKEDIFFIKPNSDSKDFAGQIKTRDEFEDWYMRNSTIGYFPSGIEDREVFVSSPKIVGKEWRLVVVDGDVVAASVYRQFQRLLPKEGCPDEVLLFANQILRDYCPADVFVLDICETINGLKVIEVNGFNSAGWYKCNIESIVTKVTEFVHQNY